VNATPGVFSGRAALGAYGGGWAARLHARVARHAGRSVLAMLDHRGPLRFQKALWPEGPEVAHLILLHPPGGIAGGDRLEIRIDADTAAHALLTTPGAGRWYRADVPAMQHVHLVCGAHAVLEWLPQETIVHDGAQADAHIDVDVDAAGTAIGMDITVLGRAASGERFLHGQLVQRLCIRRAGSVLMDEHARLRGEAFDTLARSAALAGRHVSGLLWAVGRAPFDDDVAQRVESAMRTTGVELYGASRVEPHLLIARVVDTVPQRAKRALLAAWSLMRPALCDRAAHWPRIWAT
jgi:urease accessory protein